MPPSFSDNLETIVSGWRPMDNTYSAADFKGKLTGQSALWGIEDIVLSILTPYPHDPWLEGWLNVIDSGVTNLHGSSDFLSFSLEASLSLKLSESFWAFFYWTYSEGFLAVALRPPAAAFLAPFALGFLPAFTGFFAWSMIDFSKVDIFLFSSKFLETLESLPKIPWVWSFLF